MSDVGEKVVAMLRRQLSAAEFDEFALLLDGGGGNFLDLVAEVNAEINPQSYAAPEGLAEPDHAVPSIDPCPEHGGVPCACTI